MSESVERWLAALEERHLANLTAPEVTRALRALSSCYVERRDKLSAGGALDGAGKRAAFALFYGPQHFLVVREIARALADAKALTPPARIVDLGCGTGSAGAAVAAESAAPIVAFDLNPWAVDEANWTYRTLNLAGQARVGNIRKLRIDGRAGDLVLAAYSVNELPEATREDLRLRLLAAHARGSSILIVEPIGRRANPWWADWARAIADRGGRADEWRFAVRLPGRQARLATAAGLSVGELTARSLWLRGAQR